MSSRSSSVISRNESRCVGPGGATRNNPLGRTVRVALEAGRRVRPDRELLEHADAFAVAVAHLAELLDVHVVPRQRVELFDPPRLRALGLLAVPDTVSPLEVQIPEALHLEVQDRRELEHLLRVAVVVLHRRAARAPGTPPHVEMVFNPAGTPDLVLAPPRLRTGRQQRNLSPAPVPALAIGTLEQDHVRAAILPVDRRPQEEDADRSSGHRRRAAGRLADRTHAPGPV